MSKKSTVKKSTESNTTEAHWTLGEIAIQAIARLTEIDPGGVVSKADMAAFGRALLAIARPEVPIDIVAWRNIHAQLGAWCQASETAARQVETVGEALAKRKAPAKKKPAAKRKRAKASK